MANIHKKPTITLSDGKSGGIVLTTSASTRKIVTASPYLNWGELKAWLLWLEEQEEKP